MSIDLQEWKPFPKQEEFLRVPWSVKEALFGGSAGPGKSELILLIPILYGFYRIQGFHGLILRRRYKDLDEELVIRSEITPGYYTATGGVYTGGNVRRWHWPEYGSYISFGHAQHEKDIRNYDTIQYQYIGFDELTSFTEFQYLYMFSRNRSTVPGLPSIVRAATNPGNIGHGWVRKRFIEPAPLGGKLVRDLESGHKRIYVHATVEDNPVVMKNDPGYIQTLKMLPEAEKRAKLYGDWWTFFGQVFENWRIEPLPGEPDNARHVIPPFTIPDWWPRIVSIDWGHNANLWVGWAAISPHKRVYLYREYMHRGLGIETWATEVGNLSLGENIVDVIGDWNLFENLGEPKTLAEQFRDYSKMNVRPADKGPGSRISGKILLQDYLRWRPRPERAKVATVEPYSEDVAQAIFRNRGVKAYNDYLGQYRAEEPETNLPRFQVFDTCEGVINCIPICVYEESGRDGKRPEDVKEFDGDDPYDGIRMLLRAVDRYYRVAETEFSKQLKVESAQEYLSRTADMTGFYRRMEKIDRDVKSTKSIAPVRLRRRRIYA